MDGQRQVPTGVQVLHVTNHLLLLSRLCVLYTCAASSVRLAVQQTCISSAIILWILLPSQMVYKCV